MAVSQYGDVQSKLDSGETVSEFLRDYLGFRHDFLPVAALALIAFTLFFAFIYTFSLKFLNFLRR